MNHVKEVGVNMVGIKDYLIDNLKESLKFALFATIIFIFLGFIFTYMILYVFKTNIYISSVITGAIIAIIIFIADRKKIHSYEKILENNRKISNILINRYLKNSDTK